MAHITHSINRIGRRNTARDVLTDAEVHVSRRHHLRLIAEGALVGCGVGVLIALYRFALSNAESLMRTITSTLRNMGPVILVWFVVLAGLCLAVGKLMRFEPYTQGSGIPQTNAEVAGKIDMPWPRVLVVKFVEGVMCTFAGLSLGREGPSILLGGLVGKGVSRILHTTHQQQRLLVTCGATAGMSAAFHAPLTGVLLVIEEIHKRFSAVLVVSVMIASVCSDLVCSQFLGQKPVIHFDTYNAIPFHLYATVAFMGICCGIVGSLQNKGMFLVQERLFDRIVKHAPYLRLAIPFAVAGVVAFTVPDLLCGGDAIVERLLEPNMGTFVTLSFLLLGKYLFTALCFGSGAPGGTLLPLVVMGSLLGALYGMVVIKFFGVPVDYMHAFIVLGIAGCFSSTIQAPVTAVVLVFELTGNLSALLAATTVSVIAFATSTMLHTEPFYAHLSARLLGTIESGDNTSAHEGQMIVRTINVSPGAPIESHVISEIPWPSDMIVVTVGRADTESIANGQTRIEALDKLTILMNEDSEAYIAQELERLCTPSLDDKAHESPPEGPASEGEA